MKKILLVFAIVLMTISGHAQRTADIGIWCGSSTVWGDMDDNTPFQSFNLNLGVFFRYNINARVGVRMMFITGNMANEGTVEGAPWSFDKKVQDLTMQVEINYLKYILGAKKMRFSPYVTVGLGAAMFKHSYKIASIKAFNPDYPGSYDVDESVSVPVIPFGMGVKYSLSKRISVGVEYQMRKYFSDKLDDLDDPLSAIDSSTGEEISYTSQLHNTDWAGYLGIHLVYKIETNRKACPVYEKKH